MNVLNVLDEAKALRKVDERAKALKLLNSALGEMVDPRLLYSRAMTYDESESEKAVEDLTYAIKLDNTNQIYWFERACLLAFPLNRHEQAIQDFEQVLQLNPDHVDSHRQCCGSLLIMGRPNRALTHAEAALRLAPDEAITYFYLGETYISLKRYGEAVAALKRAVDMDPTRNESISALQRAQQHLLASSTDGNKTGIASSKLARGGCDVIDT